MAGFTAAIIGAAAATFGPALFGGAIATIGSLTAFSSFLVRAAIGIALNALAPKPKTQGANRGYQVTTRGSALDHQIIYGRVRTGGVIVYDKTTGTNNKFLHRVIAFAGHEVESFDEVYINDEVLTLDGNGEVTAPDKYAGKIRVNTHLGSPDQAADSDLVAEDPSWTNEHRLRGIAYLYVRLQFDQNAFPNGVPDITATVKGKKVYDPRTDTTVWSDNPALCLRDYITEGYGLNEEIANVDDTLVASAADVCDETNTLDGSTRYTCNGAFVTQVAPVDILNDLLTSMGGLLWYAQGEWRMKPAYYVAPTVSFTEDDLRSSISVKTRHSRRDNFNTVKGTFRGEESNWQVTDYPEVTNSAFLEADNNQESVLDLELPFTDNADEARRIARIALERNRQQLTVSASFGLKAFQVQTGDIIKLTVDRFGWTEKEFEVTGWTFGLVDEYDLQVQMTLREISESVFDEVDDGIVYERDNTELLSPFEVPPVGLAISQRLEVYREKLTNFLDAKVTSGQVGQIDRVEVQFKESSAEDWINVGSGDLQTYEITDIEDGTYDIRARAINTFGVRGDWTTRSGYIVDGLSQPPEDVENFTAEVNGNTIHLSWDAVPDLDLSYYLIRHSDLESGATWQDSVNYTDKVARPSTSVSVPAKSGTYIIKAYDKTGVPSVNAANVTVPAAVIEDFNNSFTVSEDPLFEGTRTDTIIVDGSLRLGNIIEFDSLVGNLDDLEGQWDSLGIDYSQTVGQYEFSDYIDLGSTQLATARVFTTSTRVDTSSGLFDDLSGNLDVLPGLFDDLNASGASFADTNIKAYVSYTDDDPAGTPTWSNYERLRASDISARAFRFKVQLESDTAGITPSITELEATVGYN